MRLITRRRIYRAFPELDRFSDEQCERLYAAVRRGTLRTIVRWAIVLGVAAVLFWLTFFAGAVVLSEVFKNGDPSAAITGLLVGSLVVGGLSGLLAQDFLIRRRFRYVLRTRGRCASCSYSLLGLPVSAACTVRCPECGHESEVDESLGELVTADDGGRWFRPSEKSLDPWPRWLTPRRRRFIRRGVIFSAIGIPLLIGVVVGGYEAFLRVQASRAAAERPGAAAILALVQAAQPSGTKDGDPDAWEVFFRIHRKCRDEEAAAQTPPVLTSQGKEVPLGVDYIYLTAPADEDPEDAEMRALAKPLAARYLDLLKQAGVWEDFDDMASRARCVRPVDVPDSVALFDSDFLTSLGPSRSMARINAARMHLARERGDDDEFFRALEACLALARITSHQATFIDRLVACAIEALAHRQLRAALAQHPDARWLDRAAAAIARQGAMPGPAHALRGEQILATDFVAWLFSQPGRVRFGRASIGVGYIDSDSPSGSLGTYSANRDEISRRFAAALAAAETDTLTTTFDQGRSGLVLVDILLPDVTVAARSLNFDTTERRGIDLWIAIERFRVARGDYPESLDELATEFLPRLPADPFSGGPFKYRRTEPAEGAPGHGFLLYSVGPDGADNGGRAPKGRYPDKRSTSGYDLVISRLE